MILLRSVVSKEPVLLFMFWCFIVEKLALLELLTHVRNVFSGLVLAGTQLRMEQSPTVVAVDRRGLLVLGRCFDFWRSLHHQQFQNRNQHEKNKLETQSLAAFTLSRFIEARCLPLFCGETTCPSCSPLENLGYPGCIISTSTRETPRDKVVQWMLLWHIFAIFIQIHPFDSVLSTFENTTSCCFRTLVAMQCHTARHCKFSVSPLLSTEDHKQVLKEEEVAVQSPSQNPKVTEYVDSC